MASILLPRQQSFGSGLAQGFGSGLQALAQQKLQQVQQRNLGQKLQEGYGFKPEEAQAFAELPPELQKIAFKEKQAAPGRQAYAQALGLGGQEPSGLQNANQLAGLTERQASEVAKLRQQERHFETKLKVAEQKEADKETLPYYKEITKEAVSARNNDKRLDRMEQLINAGKLAGPTTNALIDTAAKGIFGIGIDLSGLQNADTQEFNKISKDFLKEAKSIFGARLTDTDVKFFLQTVPTLLNSDEGKKRVIFNLKSFNEAAKIRKQVADEIIEQNNGRRPRNIDALVEKVAGPQLDLIATGFKKGAQGQENLEEEYNKRNSILGQIGKLFQ
jgi:hypothetical protein